mgnify:FL=1
MRAVFLSESQHFRAKKLRFLSHGAYMEVFSLIIVAFLPFQ